MAQINRTPISSNHFSYHNMSFSAELSDLLACAEGPAGLFQRLYDDAADVGFMMRSERTGTDVRFYLSKQCENSEREITGWIFKPCTEEVRKNPAIRDVTVTVFND
jgi:hypothetical protein